VRDRHGHFLIEGVRFVSAAVEMSARIVGLIFSPRLLTHPWGQKLARKLRQAGVPSLRLSPGEYRTFSTAESPQGIAAIVRQRWDSCDLATAGYNSCWVCLQGIRSPGNLGNIFRTCQAAGATGAILLGSESDPYDPACVRASMSYLLTSALVRTGVEEFRDWPGRRDYRVIGAAPTARRDYRSVSYRGAVTLMLGSERKGLSATQLAFCDELVRIPMQAGMDSLNVAVAVGVLLYEAFNQRYPLRLKKNRR
jgi:TrmH family RNA methyltransferase